MKYFTKILSVFLCAAEISVLAQMPKAQAPVFTSEKCMKAVSTFSKSASGKMLDSCSTYLKKGQFNNVCSNPECINIEFPADIKAQCESKEDKVYVSLFDLAFKSFNEEMKKFCKNSNVSNNSGNSGSSSSSNKPSGGNAGNPSGNNGSSVGSTNPSAGVNSPAGNSNPSAVAPGAQGTEGAAGIPNSEADPQLSQIDPITTGNITLSDNSSSAESKLTYSLVTAFALTIFNLLL